MKVLILGGGGMVGQKLAARLASTALDAGPISQLILHDLIEPAKPDAPFPVTTRVGNIGEPTEIQAIADEKADLIFHLAAIVSGEAETDFDKGWLVNGQASWNLLEAIRRHHDASGGTYRPKLVFSSSIAVFGAPFPDKIHDEFFCTPLTSYGAQKAITELLVNDYSRKGMLDGISIRLPTVCVRPGKANLAASSFFSGIIREPLNGVDAILPVQDTVRHWHASPRSAAGFLIHAANLDTQLLNNRRALSMPGLSCTVAEQIEALERVAGSDVVKHIKHQPDPAIIEIVKNWPRDFDPKRAIDLGFRAESTFDEIIQIYIDEDLNP